MIMQNNPNVMNNNNFGFNPIDNMNANMQNNNVGFNPQHNYNPNPGFNNSPNQNMNFNQNRGFSLNNNQTNVTQSSPNPNYTLAINNRSIVLNKKIF